MRHKIDYVLIEVLSSLSQLCNLQVIDIEQVIHCWSNVHVVRTY